MTDPAAAAADAPTAARLRPLRVLASVALAFAAVLPAATALPVGGGASVQSVQPGNWSDGATWSTGAVPTASDQAHVNHTVTVQSPGEAVDYLLVQSSGMTDVLEVVDGGDLTTTVTSLGGGTPGVLRQTGGTSHHGTLYLGTPVPAFGSLDLLGGVVTAGDVELGHPLGTLGSIDVLGSAGQLSISGELLCWPSAELVIWPDAPGAAGVNAITTSDLTIQPGAELIVYPQYPAVVGDSWDILVADGTVTGSFTISSSSQWTMALDTSTPGVIRVVVTGSIYPLAGNLCADAVPLSIDGETSQFSTASLTAADPTPTCAAEPTAMDFWYRIDNPAIAARCMTARPDAGLVAFELYDDCGSNVLDCADLQQALTFTVPANSSRLLRVTTTISGSFPVIVTLTPWCDVGGGSVGIAGVPQLDVTGSLVCASGNFDLELANAPASAPMLLWLAFDSVPTDIFGGTLFAFPYFDQFLVFTDADGEWAASAPCLLGAPFALDVWLQLLIEDISAAPWGITLSNAVKYTHQ